MAEDKNGFFNIIDFDSCIDKLVSVGKVSENLGTNSTSSKVSDSLIASILAYKQF